MYSDINPPDIILMKKHMFEGGFKMSHVINYFFKVVVFQSKLTAALFICSGNDTISLFLFFSI